MSQDFDFKTGIDFGFARATDTGLIFNNHNHTADNLGEVMGILLGFGSYSRWGIGDLLIEGFDVHGEEFSQILDSRNIKAATAQKYKWVCARYSGEYRSWRLAETQLSFTHQELLAGLLAKDDEQATAFAYDLRQRALDERLSCEMLEEAIREFNGEPLPEDEIGEDVSFSTRPPLERLETIRDGLVNLIDDAPDDWDNERPLLNNAVADIEQAIHGIQNRESGGGGWVGTEMEEA